MTKQLTAALCALVDFAGGYNATPAQILEIANRFEIEAWVLEGAVFDAIDAAQE
jgi:hypothetical protein